MKALAALAIACGLVLLACKGSNPAPDLPDSNRVDAAIDSPTDAPPVCFDPAGSPANCFRQDVCDPTEDTDFLNGCTDGQCVAFDNVARLPLYNNGNLPPVP